MKYISPSTVQIQKDTYLTTFENVDAGGSCIKVDPPLLRVPLQFMKNVECIVFECAVERLGGRP